MKLITHIVFSFALAYLLLTFLGYPYSKSLISAGLFSVVINYVIDVFGHEKYHGHIRRNKLTHSLSTASIIGIVVGLAISYFMKYSLVLGVLSSLTVSSSHLFLDSITMGGIYICGRRYRLASYRYNNPVLNIGFIILSLLLVYWSFLAL